MPDSTSNPLRISGIVRRRKKTPISLLPVWYLTLLRFLLRLLLLLAFNSSPMIRLSLIAVIDQESQGACESDDDEGFNNSLVDIIEAVGRDFGGGGEVVLGGVTGVVVWMLVFDEGGEPFAE